MSGTTRRGFLQGMVASVAASSLIIEANEADVAAFGKGQEVNLIGPPPQLSWIASGFVGWSPTMLFRPGDMLYDEKGNPRCVVARVHRGGQELSVNVQRNFGKVVLTPRPEQMFVTMDVEVMNVARE